MYLCGRGSEKKWSWGDGRGRGPGLHRVSDAGRYKSLAAVGRRIGRGRGPFGASSGGGIPKGSALWPPEAFPPIRLPRTPKSEARFRVAIPEPRFEKCCFLEEE